MMFLRQFLIIAFFSAALLQMNGCPSKKPVQANQNIQPEPTPTKKDAKESKGDSKKMDLLIQKILNKEPSAVNLAKEVGSSAFSRIEPLTANEDDEVRMIAFSCLGYIGGENAAEVLINGLTDESPSVSVEASRGLKNYLSPAIYPKLLEVWDKVEDPARRSEIALMLGKIEGAKVSDLKQKFEKEDNADVKGSLRAAIAKLGDGDSKAEFLKNLQGAKDRELKKYLDYVEYINQTWALRGLSPVLKDKSDLIRIGIDGAPGLVPEYLRACDVAVNLIARLTGKKFSFDVDGKTNYSDSQIQEVNQFIISLQ